MKLILFRECNFGGYRYHWYWQSDWKKGTTKRRSFFPIDTSDSKSIYLSKVYWLWNWKFTTANYSLNIPICNKTIFEVFIFDPSFINYRSSFNESLIPHVNPLNIETILKYQKRDPVLKFLYKGSLKNHVLSYRCPLELLVPFWLNIVEWIQICSLMKVLNSQLVKSSPWKIMITFYSTLMITFLLKSLAYAYHWNHFTLQLIKIMNIQKLVCTKPNIISTKFNILHSCK